MSIYYEYNILKIPKDLIEHTSLQNNIHGYDVKSALNKNHNIKKIRLKLVGRK